MQALKDIDGVAPVLTGTPIAKSPLWNTPVDQIAPAQLTAFRARLALSGQKPQADAALNFALCRVAHAVEQAGVPTVKMLDYTEPNDRVMTTAELVSGFAQMSRPMPAAILFALETGLAPEQVVTLTRAKVKSMRRISGYAAHILRSQVISISSDYVFWRDYDGKPMPLFGMEQEIFDVFGCVWAELRQLYKTMIIEVSI